MVCTPPLKPRAGDGEDGQRFRNAAIGSGCARSGVPRNSRIPAAITQTSATGLTPPLCRARPTLPPRLGTAHFIPI